MKYIVLVYDETGRPLFLADNDRNAALFNSFNEALTQGKRAINGKIKGFKVVDWEYYKEW